MPLPDGHQPTTGRSFKCQQCARIVLVDYEDYTRELVDLLPRESLTEYTLVKSLNRDEAWREFLRKQSDLLITDMPSTNVPGRTEYFGMSGGEWLQRLAQRRVTFPILVVSGTFSVSCREGYAKQCAGPELNVSFLTKPYTMDLFWLAVRKGESRQLPRTVLGCPARGMDRGLHSPWWHFQLGTPSGRVRKPSPRPPSLASRQRRGRQRRRCRCPLHRHRPNPASCKIRIPLYFRRCLWRRI